MRENIANALKEALKSKDQVALSTMRLIVAALKDVILRRVEMIILMASLMRNPRHVANHDQTAYRIGENVPRW